MLSAAAVALLAGPAFADTTLTKVETTGQKTSATGNLIINSGAGVSLKSATVPLIEIDSSNTVNNGGSLTASGQTTATAVQIDANGLTGSFLSNGAIDLTGDGTGKTAIYLKGTGAFTGNITLDTGSTVSIAGDQSTGILTDAGSTLNGDLSLGGTFAMSPTTANETTASTITIANLQGAINGNVVIVAGSSYSAVGNAAQGIVISGGINACNATAVPGCTEIGTFANSGAIAVAGVSTRANNGVDAESGSALVIESSIAGGILNNGPTNSADTVNTNATISGNGAVPVIEIGPNSTAVTTPSAINIGIDSVDANGIYNFINRGAIAATPVDPNQSAQAILIAGTSGAPVTFTVPAGGSATVTGGLFDSGVISAAATSTAPGSTSITDTGTTANNGKSAPVNATALEIDNYVTIPVIYVSAQAATTSGTGGGAIVASITGPAGGSASAILIGGTGPTTDAEGNAVTNTVVPEIIIEKGAGVSASATASLTPTDKGETISTLSAVAIRDVSNSLTTIVNSGTISAVATLTDATTGLPLTLTGGADPIAHAVDVSLNTVGLNFTNKGTVVGDVLFGSGSDTYTIQGSSLSSFATQAGNVNFGISSGGVGYDTLHVGQFANVAGTITAQGALNVQIDGTGTLTIQNIGSTLNVQNLDVKGSSNPLSAGTLNITVSEGSTSNASVIAASGTAQFESGANLGVQYGSFIPAQGSFVLVSAPLATGGVQVSAADLTRYSQQVDGTGTTPLPFMFASASIGHQTAGSLDELVLTVVPKTVDQLGLTGYARTLYRVATTVTAGANGNSPLGSDDALGAALVAGINSKADAQKAFDAFAPDVSGGERAIAVSLTDQATGVVAARLRTLRLFGKEPGDLTLWGNEFGEYMSTHGQTVAGVDGVNAPAGCAAAGGCGSVSLIGYKDHGFGFSMGLDSGSPAGGWYGMAFTFYTGDVASNGDSSFKTNSLWYLLTGYSDWRGRGLFLDTQATVGYADFKGKRFLDLTIPATNSTFTREADSKHGGLVASLGATMGAILKFGATTITPQISLDGMTLRQEGFTEANGGTGFDLSVRPTYNNSLRLFVGSEFREDLNLGDFFLQPAARLGYRFDFLNDPDKIRAQFADTSSVQAGNQPGGMFTLLGPDPSAGNYVAGASLNATTDSWTVGLNYDFVRGSNAATEQVGTISLLGRI